MAGLLKPTTTLRLYRAGVLVAIVLLIHEQARWIENQRPREISLRDAGRFFPEARSLGAPDPARGLHVVKDSLGKTLGGLMTTSPWTDEIIGYSGPNELLLVLDPSGAIVRVELLGSGDTPEFVDAVRSDGDFLPGLVGWKPSEQPMPDVSAVSGATLTSLAVIEGVQLRLLGASPSLRFPEPVTLEEVREIVPDASRLEEEPDGLRALHALG